MSVSFTSAISSMFVVCTARLRIHHLSSSHGSSALRRNLSSAVSPLANGLYFHASTASQTNVHPILIIPSLFEQPDDNLRHNLWQGTIDYFNSKGYDVGFLGISKSSEKFSATSREAQGKGPIDSMIDDIQKAVNSKDLGPKTIIISSCLSSFVAQKYLESHSCGGLVMLNPWSPNPKALLENLYKKQLEIQAGNNASSTKTFNYDNLKKTFGYTGVFQSMFTKASPRFLIREDYLYGRKGATSDIKSQIECPSIDLVWDIYNSPVNLEPSVVPMLALYSEQERNILGEKEMFDTLAFHEIEEGCPEAGNLNMHSECLCLESDSHLFFVNDDAAIKKVHRVVEKWISCLL